MITAILLYLMVSTFLAGWWFGADWIQKVRRPLVDRAAIVGLSLVWPYTICLILKLHSEDKL